MDSRRGCGQLRCQLAAAVDDAAPRFDPELFDPEESDPEEPDPDEGDPVEEPLVPESLLSFDDDDESLDDSFESFDSFAVDESEDSCASLGVALLSVR